MSLVKIYLEDGKYTVLHNEEHGGVTVLRYGEPWRNETGDGFILAMIQRIQELEMESKLLEVKLIEDGILPRKSAREFLEGSRSLDLDNSIFFEDKEAIENSVVLHAMGSSQLSEVARVSGHLYDLGVDVVKLLRDELKSRTQ